MKGDSYKLDRAKSELAQLSEQAKEVEWTALKSTGDVMEIRRLKRSHAELLRQIKSKTKQVKRLEGEY